MKAGFLDQRQWTSLLSTAINMNVSIFSSASSCPWAPWEHHGGAQMRTYIHSGLHYSRESLDLGKLNSSLQASSMPSFCCGDTLFIRLEDKSTCSLVGKCLLSALRDTIPLCIVTTGRSLYKYSWRGNPEQRKVSALISRHEESQETLEELSSNTNLQSSRGDKGLGTVTACPQGLLWRHCSDCNSSCDKSLRGWVIWEVVSLHDCLSRVMVEILVKGLVLQAQSYSSRHNLGYANQLISNRWQLGKCNHLSLPEFRIHEWDTQSLVAPPEASATALECYSCCVDLVQGLAKHSPQATSGPLHVLVNKVLLDHSSSFIWFCDTPAELNSCL